MTAVLTPPVEPADWGSTMPGWSLAADLTPPEVIEGRRVRALRKRVVVGLAATVVACIAGFGVATLEADAAQSALATTQDETTALTAAQDEYRDVIKMQADTRLIDDQVAQLMATDVDLAVLVDDLRGTLPGTMSLTAINVTLSSVTDAAVPVAGTTVATDPSEVPIGSITLTGTSQRLADLATYVTNLERMDGVVGVLPATNTTGDAGAATWSVTLGINDALRTHRHDLDAASDGGQS